MSLVSPLYTFGVPTKGVLVEYWYPRAVISLYPQAEAAAEEAWRKVEMEARVKAEQEALEREEEGAGEKGAEEEDVEEEEEW